VSGVGCQNWRQTLENRRTEIHDMASIVLYLFREKYSISASHMEENKGRNQFAQNRLMDISSLSGGCTGPGSSPGLH
jgi:hypothetical protein